MLFSLFLLLAQSTPSFWSYWGDGKAELSSYTVTQSRYGENRTASVVLIYVTEPFSLEKQVKVDNPQRGDKDVVQVLKLNRVKNFQTGIYPYSLMTSVFSPVQGYKLGATSYAAGTPLKVSFGSQEWCGTMYHQLNRTAAGITSQKRSYFESEGDTETSLDTPGTTLFADELFIDVRELLHPMPTGSVALYPTLEYSRLFHKPLERETATIAKKDVRISSKKARVLATEWTISTTKQVWKFTVEKEYPRKILAYEHSVGNEVIESGELKESLRLPYWELHGNGDEKYAQKLKLR